MKKWLALFLSLLTTMAFFAACGSNNQAGNSQNNQKIERLNMSRLTDNIQEVLQYDISKNKLFGSAYYVYQDGVEYEKYYGNTSLNAHMPITNKTIFRLASMSKPITAVAALILVEREMLSLDDGVDKYIPAFANIKVQADANSATLPSKLPTIANILNHTSGIGSYFNKEARKTASDKQTLDASIAFYIKNGLDFEPGTRQAYSGTGAFDVLTKIIEIVSGMDYLTFLQKEIFTPCGMVDSTFLPNEEQESRLVDMHTQVDGKNAVAPMPAGCIFEDYPSTHYLGGAGLVSTISDYAKFAKMLLNKGKTDTATILQEKTFNLLCTPQVPYEIMPQNERWGFGVRVITEDTYPYLPVGSFGWSGAYGSHFWIDPVNKIFAVYMKNSKVDGGSANESAVNFERAVYSSIA